MPLTGADNDQKAHQILFGGDQLTAARARGCAELRENSDSLTGRLKTLIPVPEDWHTQVTLLTVCIIIVCDVHTIYYYDRITADSGDHCMALQHPPPLSLFLSPLSLPPSSPPPLSIHVSVTLLFLWDGQAPIIIHISPHICR